MEHRKIFTNVQAILSRRIDPYTLLDLGCGDAAAIGPAMKGTPVAKYVGVDCAAAALEFARETMADFDAPADLRLGDLLEAIEEGDETFDVILASFALHHFEDDDKKRFLSAARRRLAAGGELILIDVVRRPGESRAEYLERYSRLVDNWTVDRDKKRRIVEHVTGFDYPAEVGEEPEWARDLGYQVTEFYRGGNETQVGWLMTA